MSNSKEFFEDISWLNNVSWCRINAETIHDILTTNIFIAGANLIVWIQEWHEIQRVNKQCVWRNILSITMCKTDGSFQ